MLQVKTIQIPWYGWITFDTDKMAFARRSNLKSTTGYDHLSILETAAILQHEEKAMEWMHIIVQEHQAGISFHEGERERQKETAKQRQAEFQQAIDKRADF